MPDVPNARKSTVTNLIVTPDKWDFYPSVDRSVIKSCNFTDLSSASYIESSELKDVDLLASSPDPVGAAAAATEGVPELKTSSIEHSQIYSSTMWGNSIDRCVVSSSNVSLSLIERTELQKCNVSLCHMERVTGHSSHFTGLLRVERSTFKNSRVSGKEIKVERSEVENCTVSEGSYVSKSKIEGTDVCRSHVDRARLVDCDVVDCHIEKTEFEGMVLRNGIWKNGNLIGKKNTIAEAVVMSRQEWERKKKEEEQKKLEEEQNQQDTSIQPAEIRINTGSDLPPQKQTSHRLSQDMRESTLPSPTTGSYYSGTSLIDDADDEDDEEDDDLPANITVNRKIQGSNQASVNNNANPAINDAPYIDHHLEEEEPPPPYQA